MKLIDLSVTIEHQLPVDPDFMMAEIRYARHDEGAGTMKSFYPGLTADDLPNGEGWQVEFIKLTTHSGTHLDAPIHYNSTSMGRPAKGIDEIPLEWCFSDGVVLDFTDKPDGYNVTAQDMEEAFAKINYKLKPLDIVLVRSGAAPYYGSKEYLVRGCGMGREATLWLTKEHGVRVVGTDAWSWDRPLPFQGKEFAATKDPSLVWEGHFAGIEQEYCHMEKMANLDKLPPYGFKVACFPVKIKGASAGWVRPIAILP
ncbi:MAG: cyclase family protein [Bacillota bacterium]